MDAALVDCDQEEGFEEAMAAFGLAVPPCGGFDPVDVVENALAGMPGHHFKTENVFTPGLYSRRCHIPAGSVLVSKIHKTEHQYVITEGVISVWTKERGSVTFCAPYHGVTKPGTRRILHAITDTVWITFHPIAETDVDVIESKIIMPHTNPLLEGGPQ